MMMDDIQIGGKNKKIKGLAQDKEAWRKAAARPA